MSDPNVIGYVSEFCLDREVTVETDGFGKEVSILGPPKCKLRLNLRNTLGQIRTIWVEGPSDLAAFFDSALSTKSEELL